jgi:hypothetical protein
LSSALENTQLSNIQLFVDPDGCITSNAIDRCELTGAETFRFEFTPLTEGKFQIRGIRAIWHEVAPIVVVSPRLLRFSGCRNAPLFELSLLKRPEVAYAGVPFRFRVFVKHVKGEIGSLCAVAETFPRSRVVDLVEPKLVGFSGAYSLNPPELDRELEFEVVPAIGGVLSVHAFISYSTEYYGIRYGHVSFSVECGELRQIQLKAGNDRVELNLDDGDYSVDCECALIEKEGGTVKIKDVSPDFAGNEFTIAVSRTVLGAVIREVFKISRVFVSFLDAEVGVTNFPCVVPFRFQILCLGKMRGKLVLKGARKRRWFWVGKTKFVLCGPKKIDISVMVCALEPLAFEIGDFVSVASEGCTTTFHHKFQISLV